MTTIPRGFRPVLSVLDEGYSAFGYETDDNRQDPVNDLHERLASGDPPSWGIVLEGGSGVESGAPALAGELVPIPASAWISSDDRVWHDGRLHFGHLDVIALLSEADAAWWIAQMRKPSGGHAAAAPGDWAGVSHGPSRPSGAGAPSSDGRRSGGRPKTAALALPEFCRRLQARENAPSTAAEARYLAQYVETEHGIQSPSQKGVEKIIRDELRRRSASADVAHSSLKTP